MRKARLVFLALISPLVPTGVQAEESGDCLSDMSVTAYVRAKDGYLFDLAFLVYDGPVIQYGITAALGESCGALNGFWADLWMSNELTGSVKNDSGGNEIDWTLGYSSVWKGFPFTVSFAYYDLAPLFSDEGPIGDILQVSFDIERPFAVNLPFGSHTVAPYVNIDTIYFTGKPDGRDVSVIPHLGLRHQWQITEWLGLGHKSGVLYHTAQPGFNDEAVGYYSATLSWKVGRVTIEAPNFKTTFPLNSLRNGGGPLADGRGNGDKVFGVGIVTPLR